MSTPQINPATGATLPSVPLSSADIVPAAIQRSRTAQKEWAALTFKQRALHITKIKRFLADNAERAALVISTCNGKTRQDALATEVLPCVMACDWYASNTASALKPQKLPMGNLLFANKGNRLEYTPVGVVGIISPGTIPSRFHSEKSSWD